MTTTIAPSLGHGALDTQAGVGTSPGYDAIDRRRFWTGFERGEGVATYGSYRISQRGAGANMSVDINQDDGAYVRGDAVTLQGLYLIPPHSATINETVAASDPTNPRIDRVILEIQDNTHDASGQNRAQTRVITGTPSGGATLDNLTGAAAVPSSAILLADVLVPALATTVVDANIRDRRPFNAGIPPVKTRVDMTGFESPYVPVAGTATLDGTEFTNIAAAVLCRLTRRIVSATRVRWKYQQGATALTGNFNVGIYDASGRKIIDVGSTAFAGAATSNQILTHTITATTFEPGLYYLWVGVSSLNTGEVLFPGLTYGDNGPVSPRFIGNSLPNVALQDAAGTVTAPSTLLGYTDIGADTGNGHDGRAVPLLGLSVG